MQRQSGTRDTSKTLEQQRVDWRAAFREGFLSLSTYRKEASNEDSKDD